MISRDYIMRQVHQLASALARVILQRETGQLEEAGALLSEALTSVTGTDVVRLRRATNAELVEVCSSGGRLSPDMAVAIADVLAEDARIRRAAGDSTAADESDRRARWLYEQARRAGAAVPLQTSAAFRTIEADGSTKAEPPVHDSIGRLWTRFLKSKNEDPQITDHTYDTFFFSDNKEDADELAALVTKGRKRATSPSLWFFEQTGERIPEPGDLHIVTDWSGRARCVIETTRVEIVPFNEISEEYAAIEGEGDGSLDYWRSVHWDYYHRELAPYGIEPTPDMPIVCEYFRTVYPPLSQT